MEDLSCGIGLLPMSLILVVSFKIHANTVVVARCGHPGQDHYVRKRRRGFESARQMARSCRSHLLCIATCTVAVRSLCSRSWNGVPIMLRRSHVVYGEGPGPSRESHFSMPIWRKVSGHNVLRLLRDGLSPLPPAFCLHVNPASIAMSLSDVRSSAAVTFRSHLSHQLVCCRLVQTIIPEG
jgi:hypothetical protein